ncbi:glycosyltransferase family 2 protein [Pseudoroseicyclus aestuarii]|uniref:GT2 family glycosyltransferase n=1 Tax=Pseudoroseicyclus aestuarii TaxID=1795041 RepID=A0A318SNP0_9RHOB|nr:glycosyltransferase [Pseudoroseicyclus aestuarii]PYE82225.1 GT2 family glycosyltransferase [Pseudoroseicyclus aestuarii]
MTFASLPRVSVIIPCHDREETVREAVQSVLDQDFSELEVIAVDDRSADRTLEVLRGIEDPRLKILSNTGPQGASGARNCGVALARAPWIAFQDSDDIWLPGKLSRQMARLEDSDFVAAYCGMQVKDDARPETPVQKRYPDPALSPLEGDILPSLTRQSYISTQMLVVRRDVFDAVGGFDEALPALVDWELMLRVAQAGPVAFVDEDLVVQRMSGNSITRSSRRRLEAQAHVLAKHRDLLAGYPGVLAHHHHRLAGAHRAFGEFAPAARHAAAALRERPANPRYVLNALYLRSRALFG